MEKSVLTIEEILGRYFYLDWLQSDCRKMGLRVSGSKNELIERLLNEYERRKESANKIGTDMIHSLRVEDLKMIADDYGLKKGGSREVLINRILNNVRFEPRIKEVDRHCETCMNTTAQEMHFSDDWEASKVICSVCRHETDLVPKFTDEKTQPTLEMNSPLISVGSSVSEKKKSRTISEIETPSGSVSRDISQNLKPQTISQIDTIATTVIGLVGGVIVGILSHFGIVYLAFFGVVYTIIASLFLLILSSTSEDKYYL